MYDTQLEIYKKYPVDIHKNPTLFVKRAKAVEEFENAKYIVLKRKNNEILKKVSIIIPAKNNFKLIKGMLETINKVTFYRNIEIIVVNSATDDIFSKLMNNEAKNNKYLKLFLNKEEKKIGQMLNQGVNGASGNFIVFLLNVFPGYYWLTSMIRLYERENNVGLISGKVLVEGKIEMSENLKKICNIYEMDKRYHIDNAKIKELEACFSYLLFMERRDILRINGIDENINDIKAIINMSLKLKEFGKRILFNPFSEGVFYNILI